MCDIIVNMVERSKMSPTTPSSLVLVLSLGHQQAIIIQRSETIQELIIINQDISHVTSRYIKNMCQECKEKQYKKYKSPKDMLKITILVRKNSFRNLIFV